MQKFTNFFLITAALTVCIFSAVLAQDTNSLFKEEKVKNYLPHMSWYEVEQALKKTDMVIIPVGSIEQHGKHLPLITDTYAAIETSKLIAQETDVLVAPVVFAGLSEHHMAFPGTVTLSPETFEAVMYETALCMIQHGLTKIMFYNGHGGNTASVNNVILKIKQETSAAAVFLNDISYIPDRSITKMPDYDWHAGVGETGLMLYLTNSLVNMSLAEKPVITFPEEAKKLQAGAKNNRNLNLITNSYLFRPLDTGKKGSTRELTNTGVVTMGNPADGTAEYGKKSRQRLIKAVVKFINDWKEASKN